MSNLTDREYMEHMACYDELLDHEDNCGQCAHQQVIAQTAREFIAKGETVSPKVLWEEVTRRWKETKYFKLWQEERAAGRDPYAAFAERGWEA